MMVGQPKIEDTAPEPPSGHRPSLRPAVGRLVATGLLAITGCHEGLEDTVWDDDERVRTLTFWDAGATWEVRSVDTTAGERVVAEGLRFEGNFTETEDGADARVHCVSAENGALATPCDASVTLALSCVVLEDDDASLRCEIGDEEVVLHRRGVRKVR